jgi:hypothetical protein
MKKYKNTVNTSTHITKDNIVPGKFRISEETVKVLYMSLTVVTPVKFRILTF